MRSSLVKAVGLVFVVFSSLAFEAPIRSSEELAQSNYESWLISELEGKLLGKRVHAKMQGRSKVISVGGIITKIYYRTPTPPVDEDFDKLALSNIMLEIKSWHGDKVGDKVDVPLSALSGMATATFPNSHIYSTTQSNSDMIRAGFPNIVLTAYDDGYLEVFVEGIYYDDKGRMPPTVLSSVTFIHVDDILRDPDLILRKGSHPALLRK